MSDEVEVQADVPKADVSHIKVKFIIEGLGEAEGELVRFLSTKDN